MAQEHFFEKKIKSSKVIFASHIFSSVYALRSDHVHTSLTIRIVVHIRKQRKTAPYVIGGVQGHRWRTRP